MSSADIYGALVFSRRNARGVGDGSEPTPRDLLFFGGFYKFVIIIIEIAYARANDL